MNKTSDEYAVEIALSDVKPGVVLLTFTRSDGEYIGVKLAGPKLTEFVQSMVMAYSQANADLGKVAIHIAMKQIETFIARVPDIPKPKGE